MRDSERSVCREPSTEAVTVGWKSEPAHASNQAPKSWCLFEGRLMRIRVYKRGLHGTFFAGNVAESDGM